jgi:hypothetical protein
MKVKYFEFTLENHIGKYYRIIFENKNLDELQLQVFVPDIHKSEWVESTYLTTKQALFEMNKDLCARVLKWYISMKPSFKTREDDKK